MNLNMNELPIEDFKDWFEEMCGREVLERRSTSSAS